MVARRGERLDSIITPKKSISAFSDFKFKLLQLTLTRILSQIVIGVLQIQIQIKYQKRREEKQS
jgi:hypothetical protein